jgi:XTP/dITP diphosphohydrolase
VDRLLIATTNRDKLREIRAVLVDVPLLALSDLPAVAEPEETGSTFGENARQKALYYDRHAAGLVASADQPLLTVAEDSGFEIDALDGEPGVRSARFLRTDATYPERFAEIYRRLAMQPGASRAARFICALAVVERGRVIFEAIGTVEGEIAQKPRGSAGFGYDPIFLYPPYARTLAEVTQAEKLIVAHRGQAFRKLRAWLIEREGDRSNEERRR